MIQDINGLTAGWYYVTITDGAGCTVLDSAEINALAPTPAAFAGNDSTLCNNSTQLWAQAPASGTGHWQMVNGAGNLQNPALPNSQLSNLQQAQEVWLLNATRGIQDVSHFQDKIYSHDKALKLASELEDFLSL